MIDKRYACYTRLHKECYCGAMDEAPDSFEPIDLDELYLYNNYYPGEEPFTPEELEDKRRELSNS